MEHNGKRLWTADNINYSKMQIGDYVTQEVVDDAMGLLPPAHMTSFSSQIGEPYSHRQDPDTGKWRSTYTTFKRVSGEYPNGIWMYCGHCFYGENVERGTDPVYVS